MTRACGECEFFHKFGGPSEAGECRRRSPSAGFNGAATVPVVVKGFWCGEFSALSPQWEQPQTGVMG